MREKDKKEVSQQVDRMILLIRAQIPGTRPADNGYTVLSLRVPQSHVIRRQPWSTRHTEELLERIQNEGWLSAGATIHSDYACCSVHFRRPH